MEIKHCKTCWWNNPHNPDYLHYCEYHGEVIEDEENETCFNWESKIKSIQAYGEENE